MQVQASQYSFFPAASNVYSFSSLSVSLVSCCITLTCLAAGLMQSPTTTAASLSLETALSFYLAPYTIPVALPQCGTDFSK